MLTFDIADKFTTVGLSVSSILFYFFYNRYKNREISANQVKTSVEVLLDENLKERLENTADNRIAYANVAGIVTALGDTIRSQHDTTKEGVLIHSTLEEHKSKRINGVWSDTNRTIRNMLDSVQFCLSSPTKQDADVTVTEVGEAHFIIDELTITYDKFEPSNASLLQVGMDRVFGEMVKGLHEKEEMLLVGTPLLGLGELFLENGKIKLGPSQGMRYILTKLSKKEVIKKLQSQSYVFKVLMIISGFVSTGLLAYLIWNFTRKYFERARNRQVFEDARQGLNNVDSNESNECVICLQNPRDIVILNCGHVALCSSCAELLPNRICPVCRNEIVRFVPLYQS